MTRTSTTRAATIGPADPRLQLAPPGERAGFWLFALSFALPMVLALVVITVPLLHGSPARLIGDSLPLTIALPLVGLAVVCGLLWWVLSHFMRRQSLQVVDGTLDLRSSFYRDRVPLSELGLDRARVVDPDEHTEFKPILKTNGFSIPGFRSGWFLLRNRRRSFVAIGDGRRQLWLPTSGKHDLLIEPRDPAALVAHLRELAATRSAG